MHGGQAGGGPGGGKKIVTGLAGSGQNSDLPPFCCGSNWRALWKVLSQLDILGARRLAPPSEAVRQPYVA
jgi:hypothetical protein